MLTYEKAREIFDYDAATGELIYKKVPKKGVLRVGDRLGSPSRSGYLQCCIDWRKYAVHRVIWLWHYGYLPEHEIDHINRNRTCNYIENLREVSAQCNRRNSSLRGDNTSGIKGVSFNSRTGKWVAQIAVYCRQFYLGYYDDFDDAVCARLAAEQCLNWSGCDSSSPAFVYVQKMLAHKENN